MSETTISFESLLKVRKNVVDVVDVPEYGFAMLDGSGRPDDPEFAGAIQALYAVSYGAHFLLKKRDGQAPRVMPLEALWWVDDPAQQDLLAAVARGEAVLGDVDRDCWRWRAMIMQPSPVDADVVADAVREAQVRNPASSLMRLRYERWAEGLSAQVLHVGPYASEGPTIIRLHEGIAAAGYHPRGKHHEIYLGDPRRCAPERLRTIVRQPIELLAG